MARYCSRECVAKGRSCKVLQMEVVAKVRYCTRECVAKGKVLQR